MIDRIRQMLNSKTYICINGTKEYNKLMNICREIGLSWQNGEVVKEKHLLLNLDNILKHNGEDNTIVYITTNTFIYDDKYFDKNKWLVRGGLTISYTKPKRSDFNIINFSEF